MRAKKIKIKRSDTSSGLYNVVAPDKNKNNIPRFRNRPSTTSQQKP